MQQAGSLRLGLAFEVLATSLYQRRRNRHRLAKYFTIGKAKRLESWSYWDMQLVPPHHSWIHDLQKALELLSGMNLTERVMFKSQYTSVVPGVFVSRFPR